VLLFVPWHRRLPYNAFQGFPLGVHPNVRVAPQHLP